MRRGMTLIELLAALIAISMAVGGALAMMVGGLRSFQRTQADVNVSQPTAQAMRRVADTLRSALSITISNSGKTISYTLPAIGSTDATTGEAELTYPMVSDGVTRSFTVTNGNLVSYPSGRILLRNVQANDPQPNSSQYNLPYAPFQSTTIGSRRAITITLIALERAGTSSRYARMKSTVLIQNAR